MARILIIDDSELDRDILRDILESGGHEVVEASNSADGVETFRRRHIDLIITDLFMPPGGGVSVIQKVRAFDEDVKIVVVSGMSLENSQVIFDKVLKAGATCTLEKPVVSDVLLQTISDLLADGAS